MAKIEVSFIINVTDRDIETIIEIARKGVLHWCHSLVRLSEYTIALDTKIHAGYYTLTHDNIITGIKKYVENPTDGDFLEFVDHEIKLNTSYINENIADAIIQYALFDHVIYIKGVKVES